MKTTIYLGTLPSIKALKAFDWFIKRLKNDNIISSATLTARCDVRNSRPSDSPGTKLANFWRSNSIFYNKVRHSKASSVDEFYLSSNDSEF